MNNKKLGSEFEKEFCELLKNHGFWVHFCTPSPNGSQPCDVIAIKNGEAYLIDCKTSIKEKFSVTRLEDNQLLAFEKWGRCGNKNRFIAVKYDNKVYMLPYLLLKEMKRLVLIDEFLFERQVVCD